MTSTDLDLASDDPDIELNYNERAEVIHHTHLTNTSGAGASHIGTSISLEFDDYPLDLVASVVRENDVDPSSWKPVTPRPERYNNNNDVRGVPKNRSRSSLSSLCKRSLPRAVGFSSGNDARKIMYYF